MVSINEVHNLTYFIAAKQLSGFPSPQEWNNFANLANIDLYNYYNDERRKQLVNVKQGENIYAPNVLSNFISNDIFLPTNANSASQPSDYIDAIAMNTSIGGLMSKVNRVNLDDLPDYLKSTIDPPTATEPIYVELATGFNIYPVLATPVYLTYYNQPVTVVWNYTMTSGRPVYEPNGSVDFQWQSTEVYRLTSRVLFYMGLSARDTELEKAAQEMTNTAS